jgi:glycosyltransferase involved in cell wall biosynthesis
MPSKQEGFGIVFIEALACGKPVLAGNQDGSAEALRNGELGVLVDPNNIKEIADNLIQILKNEHPNKTIYNPQLLRGKAIEYFGFEKFKITLKKHLEKQNICAG